MKKYLLLFVCFCLSNHIFSQITSRLTIETGGSIYFNFNSLDKYTNGIKLADWTEVRVSFEDPSAIPAKWILDVRASELQLDGVQTPFTLDLNTIEMEATTIIGLADAALPIALTNSDQHLVINGVNTAPTTYTTVKLTYYCGQSITVPNNSVLGGIPDFYFVYIYLTLQPQP
jgi:hypothetical protein